MTATTAARVQTTQSPTVRTKTSRLRKTGVRRESATRTTIEDCDVEPIALGASLAPLVASETESDLSVAVPLNGVDARHIYVLVSAHAITVEIRIKHTVVHSGVIYKECQDQCVKRELQFRSAIKEGSTAVQMGANGLEIICCKEAVATERIWSEFVRINTRGSLGCI